METNDYLKALKEVRVSRDKVKTESKKQTDKEPQFLNEKKEDKENKK